jgi:hypothetical protein
VDGQNFLARRVQFDVQLIERLESGRPFVGCFGPSAIDQDAPHCFCRGTKEVATILPFGLAVSAKTKPGFTDRSGGLESLSAGFPRQLCRSQSAEFIVDQGQ